MADELSALEDWAGALLRQVGAAGQRQLAKDIATALRKSQQQRIAQQQNPDGTPFAPRRSAPKLRAKKGRIKRAKMFAKLRTSTWLKAKAEGATAVVEFTGRAANIAKVHQLGLVDKVSSTGPRVRYPRRILLGFSTGDRALIRDTVIDRLSR
jgi:phage virion morphogenesis protein